MVEVFPRRSRLLDQAAKLTPPRTRERSTLAKDARQGGEDGQFNGLARQVDQWKIGDMC